MKKNIGTRDRRVRIVLGIAILSMLLWAPGGLRWLGLIGLIPLVTAAIGFCPLYTLFGISTNKEKTE